MFAASAAFLISSALLSSGSVGTWATSKPTSFANLKRSAALSFAGSISYQTPFLMESVGGDAAGALEIAPAIREFANGPPPRLAAQAAVTEDFKNSRRVGERIGNLSAVYLSRFSNPILLWISSVRPKSLRVPCKPRCAPSCRKARTQCLSRLGYGNSRW